MIIKKKINNKAHGTRLTAHGKAKSDPCQLMTENDCSWVREDHSWRKKTAHGEDQPYEGLFRKMMGGTIQKLPVKRANGSIDLIEIDGIFYMEARGDDTLIRTKRNGKRVRPMRIILF